MPDIPQPGLTRSRILANFYFFLFIYSFVVNIHYWENSNFIFATWQNKKIWDISIRNVVRGSGYGGTVCCHLVGRWGYEGGDLAIILTNWWRGGGATLLLWEILVVSIAGHIQFLDGKMGLALEPLQRLFSHDPWAIRCDRVPWPMGHTTLYDVVRPMEFNLVMEYELYDALGNYYFPMTHGSYDIVQPMGHGVLSSHGSWVVWCFSRLLFSHDPWVVRHCTTHGPWGTQFPWVMGRTMLYDPWIMEH